MSEKASDRVSGGAWLTLAVLVVMVILSYLDRGLVALLVKPIREDLGVDDVQISMLYGLAFGLFYAIFALPLGWLADRWSRRGVIFFSISLWSLATAACGLATTFWQLAVARFAVGFGEGGLSPAAYRMLSEIFPKRRIAMALGIFGAGAALASPISLLLGGAVVDWANRQGQVVLPLIGEAKPWHLVFLVIGPIGLFLAPLIFLTRANTVEPAAAAAAEPAGGFFAFVKSRAAYVALVTAGFAAVGLVGYGFAAWTPTFFQRRFGLTMTEIGLGLSVTSGLAGTSGYIFQGWLADRLFERGMTDAHQRLYIWFIPLMAAGAVYAFAFAPTSVLAFAGLVVFQFFLPTTAPVGGHLQLATPVGCRSRVTALFMLFFSTVGMIFGPLTVALLTERLFHDPGKVGLSLAVTIAGAGAASFLFFVASLGPARRAIALAEA